MGVASFGFSLLGEKSPPCEEREASKERAGLFGGGGKLPTNHYGGLSMYSSNLGL